MHINIILCHIVCGIGYASQLADLIGSVDVGKNDSLIRRPGGIAREEGRTDLTTVPIDFGDIQDICRCHF